jgi:hypothetical protein
VSDDELAAKVGRLERRVRALEQIVGRLARLRPELAPIDRDWLVDLLPAIVAAIGDATWALPDLAALSLLQGNDSLASAIAPHTGRAGGLRSLGKALSRCAGHIVDGFELRQVGTSRDGIVWQCVFENRENRAADCASDSTARTIGVSASCASRST